MKNYLLLFFLFISVSLFSQTTLDEYNYVTKGYNIQINSGLDMKNGYQMMDLFETSYSTPIYKRTFVFKQLIRTSTQLPCAILMIYKKHNQAPAYLCIPSAISGQQIWDLANSDFCKVDNGNAYQAMSWALMQLASRGYKLQ